MSPPLAAAVALAAAAALLPDFEPRRELGVDTGRDDGNLPVPFSTDAVSALEGKVNMEPLPSTCCGDEASIGTLPPFRRAASCFERGDGEESLPCFGCARPVVRTVGRPSPRACGEKGCSSSDDDESLSSERGLAGDDAERSMSPGVAAPCGAPAMILERWLER